MTDRLLHLDFPMLGRSQAETAPPRPVLVTHVQREKLAVAVEHGRAYEAAADAVTAACTQGLARCAWPVDLSVSLRTPGGFDPHREDVVLGVNRAASAHGLALASMTWQEGGELALTVTLRASGLRVPEPARAGDVVVGLTANGLHEYGHAAALRAVEAAGGPSAADLKRVFALQKGYQSVLHTPLREGWYRHGWVPAGGALLDELGDSMPNGLSLEGSLASSDVPESLHWMAGFTGSAGFGLALVVPAQRVDALIQHVGTWGERAAVLARVVA